MTSPWPTSPCRGCQGPVIWAITAKGARVPVDAEPVDVSSDAAQIRLRERPGAEPLAETVTNPAQLFGATLAYRRHMAVCPQAAYFRGRAIARTRRRGQS